LGGGGGFGGVWGGGGGFGFCGGLFLGFFFFGSCARCPPAVNLLPGRPLRGLSLTVLFPPNASSLKVSPDPSPKPFPRAVSCGVCLTRPPLRTLAVFSFYQTGSGFHPLCLCVNTPQLNPSVGLSLQYSFVFFFFRPPGGYFFVEVLVSIFFSCLSRGSQRSSLFLGSAGYFFYAITILFPPSAFSFFCMVFLHFLFPPCECDCLPVFLEVRLAHQFRCLSVPPFFHLTPGVFFFDGPRHFVPGVERLFPPFFSCFPLPPPLLPK